MRLSYEQIQFLNDDIKAFSEVTPIEYGKQYHELKGIAQTVMLDRYAFKDTKKTTLRVGDFVVLTIKDDPMNPQRGFGIVKGFIKGTSVTVELDPQFQGGGTVTKPWRLVDKPLEVYYEQIAARVARALASVEDQDFIREEFERDFYTILANKDYVPAGRVLYGAGSGAGVTYFNCFAQPFPDDSRLGIAQHRGEVMEIMSRGGGKLLCS